MGYSIKRNMKHNTKYGIMYNVKYDLKYALSACVYSPIDITTIINLINHSSGPPTTAWSIIKPPWGALNLKRTSTSHHLPRYLIIS